MTPNDELRRLYDEDQDDRARLVAGEGIEAEELAERDRLRRVRVHEMLARAELHRAEDYHRAAMLFHHGASPEEFAEARRLALRAVELSPRGALAGLGSARWLAAAALDRWLVHHERPQRYGTQFYSDGVRWRPVPVDPATTEKERAAWDVPSFEETERLMLEYCGPADLAPRPQERPWYVRGGDEQGGA